MPRYLIRLAAVLAAALLALAVVIAVAPVPARAATPPGTVTVNGKACTSTACVRAEITKWAAKVKGKRIDLDGMYGAQCVDLTNAYVRTVWGLHGWQAGNARTWWYSTPKQVAAVFDKIPVKGEVPQVGDIPVWADSWAGHVAVVVTDGFSKTKQRVWSWMYAGTIRVVQQNAPRIGDATNRSWYVTRQIVGYLRPTALVEKTTLTKRTSWVDLKRRYGVTEKQLRTLNKKTHQAHPKLVPSGTTIQIRK